MMKQGKASYSYTGNADTLKERRLTGEFQSCYRDKHFLQKISQLGMLIAKTLKLKRVIKQPIPCLSLYRHENKTIPDPGWSQKKKTTLEKY